MKEYVLRYFSWLASQRFRLAMLLGLTLPTILLADSLTPASACSMACRSYEVEAAASDLVFLGQVEDVRVENGSSVATVRPLRWIKGSTQLPIVATAPLRRTRDEREFGCPGPIRVTRGTVRVFGAMRSPDGASFSVRTDYCANAALNSPGNPDDEVIDGDLSAGPFAFPELQYSPGNPAQAPVRGFELFWDGRKVNGPDAESYTNAQAQQACSLNRRPGIKIECRFNGQTFYKE